MAKKRPAESNQGQCSGDGSVAGNRRRPGRGFVGSYLLARLKAGFMAWLFVVKLSVPAILLTRLLLYFDLIPYVAAVFKPLMGLVGLPGEAALVWVSGMLANLYVAVAVYASLAPGLEPLTLSQATTLGCLGLLAHGLLIEGQICRAIGLSFWRVTLFRVFSALLLGLLIRLSVLLTGWGQEPAAMLSLLNFSADPAPPWGAWLISVLKQFLMILLMVESLMLLMDLIRVFGLTRLIMIVLGPPLRLAGISEEAVMVTVIGCIVGLAYGGGLILAESRSGRIAPHNIFGAMMLMAVFHSLVEDTLVMWAIGGSLWWLLGARAVFGLALTSLVTRLARRPFWRLILVGRQIEWPDQAPIGGNTPPSAW